MRQITAAEVKPGMEVQWTYAGITRQCTPSYVETVSPRGGAYLRTFEGGSVQIPSDVKVTVLAEPQPEEPVTLCARIVVAGRKIYRWTEDPKEPWPWRGEALNVDPVLWSWGQLSGLGPVTVVDAAPSWTAPADREPTPEVPDRIEEWDTWEDVPEGVVVTTPGLFCHYRKNQGVVEFSDPDNDPDWTKADVRHMPRCYSPWTRVTDDAPEVPERIEEC